MEQIEVKNLTKSYKIYDSKVERFLNIIGLKSNQTAKRLTILDSINFNVPKGQCLGVVGVNGAGKSTILKILAGVSPLTSGSIKVKGRVASLLELGMGLHQNSTGRENIHFVSRLHGITADKIEEVEADVEVFSELDHYLDMPIRTYSSGMQMRLAFSIATAIVPDVLIIDEALSVGDAYFQHKSFQRIKSFKKLGVTILLVSHDKSVVQNICDRAILISDKKVAFDGLPEDAMNFYNALLNKNANNGVVLNDNHKDREDSSSGTGEVSTKDVGLYKDNERVEVIGVGHKITLKVKAEILHDIKQLVFGFGIKDKLGQVIFGTNTFHSNQILDNLKKGDECNFEVTFLANFGPGTYSIQTAFVGSDTHLDSNYEWREFALVFTIVNFDKDPFLGTSFIEHEMKAIKL